MPRQDARPNPPADDVAAAADQLHAAGKPVTIDTLRDALGGGSPAAIGRAQTLDLLVA